MKRETLTLRKSPDPAKIALSLQVGFRFVERKGNRYILQGMVQIVNADHSETTWVDIPLVPEVYGAQA